MERMIVLQNMQICLEHILLDGLSISEALKIQDGPSEVVLEVCFGVGFIWSFKI